MVVGAVVQAAGGARVVYWPTALHTLAFQDIEDTDTALIPLERLKVI